MHLERYFSLQELFVEPQYLVFFRNYCPQSVNVHLDNGIAEETSFNSLAPAICVSKYKVIIFKLIIQNNSLVAHYEISLRWMSQNLTNEKSTLVQIISWCRQETSHYPCQCWPRSMTPYGFTRPHWVKTMVSDIDTDCGLWNNSLCENNKITTHLKIYAWKRPISQIP